MKYPTVIMLVLDALGCDTIDRYIATTPDIHLPHFESLGLGNVLSDQSRIKIEPAQADLALVLNPTSRWADSVMGHRELMGFIDPADYRLFMDGFPSELVEGFQKRIGIPVLFNRRAGGMDAIVSNHQEHVATQGIVLYASMCDPIAQLAADENVISPDKLRDHAQALFDLSQEFGVRITRVITRPYIRKGDKFERTSNRHDQVIQLPKGTIMLIDILQENDVQTISVGKCADVVNTTWYEDCSLKGDLPQELRLMYTAGDGDKNPYSIREALRLLRTTSDKPRFIMVNCPDTDSLTGHERNIPRSLQSMAALDYALGLLFSVMEQQDVLFVTADHGMRDGGDYGYHSKEAVPLLARGFCGRRLRDEVHVPSSRDTYAVAGYLAAQILMGKMGGEEYKERCKLEIK